MQLDAGVYIAAMTSFDDAIRLNSNLPMAHACKGDTLNLLGRNDEAVKSYSIVIELDPSNTEAYNKSARILNQLGRYDKALDSLNETIRLDANNAIAHGEKKPYPVPIGPL